MPETQKANGKIAKLEKLIKKIRNTGCVER